MALLLNQAELPGDTQTARTVVNMRSQRRPSPSQTWFRQKSKSELRAALVSGFFSRSSQSACCASIFFQGWLSYCCACELAVFKRSAYKLNPRNCKLREENSLRVQLSQASPCVRQVSLERQGNAACTASPGGKCGSDAAFWPWASPVTARRFWKIL